MEHLQRTKRRSASHGPLGQSSPTDAHGIPCLPLSHLRAPLRSVSENAFLLASPAPLESILKKTTETGDIGQFTIGPVRSTSASYVPVRPRPAWSESTSIGAPSMKGIDGPDLVDDRRGLPSYRNSRRASSLSSTLYMEEQTCYRPPSGDSFRGFTRRTKYYDRSEDTDHAFRDAPAVPGSPSLFPTGAFANSTVINNATSVAAPDDILALFPPGRCINGKALRRLKKHFPDLEARLAEGELPSPDSVTSIASGQAQPKETVSREQGCELRPRRFKGRISRWLRKARQALARTRTGKRG
ncbi:hypothetical protein C8A00DRAFT_16257 [Chaetomidium leptoderma]|uniref:Uncharacterized protein n=1 Tax=Chaetomidium leptoderma TaxID=669021 RepID=A0AAN6VJI8_9PEZI|nr:hypothetical protein C8A00DRAFT_16257 [Chaetomidium leptoderma]